MLPAMAVPLRRHLTALLVIGLGVSLLSSCQGSEPPRRDTVTRYVALGDSTVSGPGINVSSGPCQRSDHNYASLLADALKIGDFVDSSCTGATTHDILHEMQRDDGVVLPAQIDSVTSDTDLVTIAVGANDANFIPDLFGCRIPGETSKACRKLEDSTKSILAKTRKNIVEVLEAIQKQAPRARIVMLGYLRLMPDSGTCTKVQIAPPDLEAAAEAEGQLERAMHAAAKDAGVEYVGMRKASEGHDACADKGDAWVNGNVPAYGDGAVLHPNERGMKAVERALRPVVKKILADEKG